MAKSVATSQDIGPELDIEPEGALSTAPLRSEQKGPLFDYEPLDMDQSASNEIPFNGEIVMLSDDESKPGRAAMWRRTRRFNAEAYPPWEKVSFFADPATKLEIKNYDPICWRRPNWHEVSP